MILFTRNKSVMVCDGFNTNKNRQNLTPTVTPTPEFSSNLPTFTAVLPPAVTPTPTIPGPPKPPTLVMPLVLPVVNPLENPSPPSTNPYMVKQLSTSLRPHTPKKPRQQFQRKTKKKHKCKPNYATKQVFVPVASPYNLMQQQPTLKKIQQRAKLFKRKTIKKCQSSNNRHATMQVPLQVASPHLPMQQSLSKKSQKKVSLLNCNTKKKLERLVLSHIRHVTMHVSVKVTSPRIHMRTFVTKKNQQQFKCKMKKKRKIFRIRSKRINYGLLLMLMLIYFMNINAMKASLINTENYGNKSGLDEQQIVSKKEDQNKKKEIIAMNIGQELMIPKTKIANVLSSVKKHPIVSSIMIIFLFMVSMCAIFIHTGPLIYHLAGSGTLMFSIIFSVLSGDAQLDNKSKKKLLAMNQKVITTFPQALENTISYYYALRWRIAIFLNISGIALISYATYLCYSFSSELYPLWILHLNFVGIVSFLLSTLFTMEYIEERGQELQRYIALDYLQLQFGEWYWPSGFIHMASTYISVFCTLISQASQSITYFYALWHYSFLFMPLTFILCIVLMEFNILVTYFIFQFVKKTSDNYRAFEWYTAVGVLLYPILSDILSMYMQSMFISEGEGF